MALAGGVSVNLPSTPVSVQGRENAISPDGQCRAFDNNARGTTVGSGVGVVLLKRLRRARGRMVIEFALDPRVCVNNDVPSK